MNGQIDSILLNVRLPRENQRKEVAAKEMLEGFHSLLRPQERFFQAITKKTISLEITTIDRNIRFYVWAPQDLQSLIEGQIYAQYPEAEIEPLPDYAVAGKTAGVMAGAELHLTNADIYPIKTYKSFEVDPLVSLAAVMAKTGGKNEQVWLQILLRPVGQRWWHRGARYASYRLTGSPVLVGGRSAEWREAVDKAIDEKVLESEFKTKIRILCFAPREQEARDRLASILGSFRQYGNPDLQGFKFGKITTHPKILADNQKRNFRGKSYILNTEETATVYHFPYQEAGVAGAVTVTSKKAEPPWNLPREDSLPLEKLSLFGETTFRDEKIKFGIKREDRPRHLYIVGKTGMGKSKLLELLVLADVFDDQGFAVLDPHGDLAEDILRYIPKRRIKDVVYFNPTDYEYPIAFNPMEAVDDPEMKQHIAAGFVGIFKKLFGVNWNPRLEHMVRYITLALLDTPQSTVLGIVKILSDKSYRQHVIAQIQDPVVKSFWVNEFAAWNEKFDNEAIVPILNKVGQFVASFVVRNTVGQATSTFDLSDIMDNGKILIMNLSTGRLGEDNSALLGSMIITRFQQAAMARAAIPEEKRRDFYLYVDEFQEFATDAFINILSEARKYRLNLTVAHQYITQLPSEIKATAFGNVGSIIAFRLGAEDAAFLQREFSPAFTPEDMINLNFREMCVKMSIDGRASPAFSGQTLTVPVPSEENKAAVIEASRTKYGRPRVQVEKEIAKWGVIEELEIPEEEEEKFAEPIIEEEEEKPKKVKKPKKKKSEGREF